MTMADEPLRAFLADALPEQPVDMLDGEMITDAVVCFRLTRIEDGAERYRYTTTSGVTQASMLGMLDIAMDQLTAVITSDVLDDEDDDGL